MTDNSANSFGVLHPGMMGSSVANALINTGCQVCWASEGRSDASKARATKLALKDCGNLVTLNTACNVIFSVCPPAAALDLANEVIANGFHGIYVDCNAIAPSTSEVINEVMQHAGVDYVDGGIIGPPAWSEGTTRLYLSGQRAADIATVFNGSLLQAIDLGGAPTAASALKMAYAGWTKGSAALLLSVYALAQHHDLGDALLKEWGMSQTILERTLNSAAKGNAPKAWRFIGEMQQIGKTMKEAGLHPGAFENAADVYLALYNFKSVDAADITTDAVIQAILDQGSTSV